MKQFQVKRVLWPTDFSENSKHAMNYACDLADQFQAELHVLHVVEVTFSPTVAEPYAAFGLPADFEDRVRAAAQTALSEVPDPAWPGNRRVVRVLRQGSPFAEILQYSREKNIDMIVLGTHGRSGLKHMLLGSVAEKVVRKAACPVLTVRPPDQQLTTA